MAAILWAASLPEWGAAQDPRRLAVVIVQAGLYDPDADTERGAREVFSDYRRLTAETADAAPELVVWPETAVAAGLPRDIGARGRIGRVAQSTRSFMLVGRHHSH